LKYFYLTLISLCLSIAAQCQTIEWTKNFDTSNQAAPAVKVDSSGNSYLYNAIFTGANANIVKLDKDGNQLWSIKMIDPNSGLFYAPLFITIDDAQNVYGVTTELSYTGFELQATNGSFHMGPTGYDSNQELVAFKLDKNGTYLWSATVGCSSAVLSGIAYDKYANMVYPVTSYAQALYSTAGNLVSPGEDITQIAFFWAIDANSGSNKAVSNLYTGLPGTIVPLPDRISYFTSNAYQYGVAESCLQLDRQGKINKSNPFDISQLSAFQGTDVSPGYYYDSGVVSDFSILGYFNFRNRIRKFDHYGNSVKETDYSMFDTVQQQTVQVLSTSGIKEIDDQNVLLYATNLNDYKTYFLGDSLAKYDFRLVFMDKNFNVTNNIHCSSTSYLIINSFTYNKSDSSYYFLMSGNQANTIRIGSAVITVPPHDFNVNYSYLAKIRFNNVNLISDAQPAIVSMLFDQQFSSAMINDTLATVTATAQPGTDLSSLSPVFTLTDNTKFKDPLAATIDFTKPLNVTLVNGKGIERSWTVRVIKTGNKNNIDTLSFPQQLTYTRDTTTKTIHVVVDRTVNLQNTGMLTFKADQYATVSPDPLSVKDFSSSVVFEVTAENGDVANWTITVTRKLSDANDILQLQLTGEGDTAHINDINKIVTIRSQTLTTSIESIKLSDGAMLIAPLSNSIDFSNPVTFEIQAENGDIADWQIKVSALPFSALDVVKAFPNPASDVLNVSLDSLPQSAVSVSLSSVFGEKLLTQNFAPSSAYGFSINVNSYLPGTYLLNVTVDGHVYAKKVIIKH
jgi:hypothetical protein